MRRTFGAARPRIAPSAFVHDTAELIGAVAVGPGASIWPFCVLRGDVDRIVIGARSNIQDLTVIHCRERQPAVIGKGVTVGHRVVLHGCRIGDGCLIGMGAVVMEASIGRECLVAAGTLVLAGMKIPARSLVLGSPARVARKLTPAELQALRRSASGYVGLARRHRDGSKAISRGAQAPPCRPSMGLQEGRPG